MSIKERINKFFTKKSKITADMITHPYRSNIVYPDIEIPKGYTVVLFNNQFIEMTTQ